MLKKSLILCLLLLGFSATPWAQGGGMSDKQVMEYVEMGMKQGKSQQQIATELARRGVTREQAVRVPQQQPRQSVHVRRIMKTWPRTRNIWVVILTSKTKTVQVL